MFLKPSNIFYSQASISCTFGRSTIHSGVPIGETLDELYNGKIQVRDIPNIRVVKKDDKWVTLDNRRLWIFHHLEGAGKCSQIEVEVIEYDSELYGSKFDSKNGGTSVSFISRFGISGPGGKCRLYITPVVPTVRF